MSEFTMSPRVLCPPVSSCLMCSPEQYFVKSTNYETAKCNLLHPSVTFRNCVVVVFHHKIRSMWPVSVSIWTPSERRLRGLPGRLALVYQWFSCPVICIMRLERYMCDPQNRFLACRWLSPVVEAFWTGLGYGISSIPAKTVIPQ
jgi:hypothetical protein